ncbi:hemerythrin domain-containing protein [Methanobacterium oryzae]|uniref:hemerythrin domain-containing protein n=1 Tax=Methanobacterium oryzae TaxID=69540 RepID=UPI003D1ED3DA
MTEELYKMLKDDHKVVKDLLNEALENEDISKFREIRNQLNMHMISEEKYFYPPLRKVNKESIDQSFKEHEEAKIILKDIEKTQGKNKDWIPKFKKLKETIETHVEKEENLLFPESSESLSTLQREGIAQKIEEEKMVIRFRSIPDAKLVSLPENIDVPRGIPTSRVKIPSMYANGDIEYEDDEEKQVDKDNASHIRFTGIDRRSDIVVGPIKPEGMIKLTLYFNDENLPVVKDKATNSRSKIFNEEYRPLRK